MPTVFVWKRRWLPGSETFIRNQTDSLQGWTSVAFGVGREASPLARESDRILFSENLIGAQKIRALSVSGRSRTLTRFLRAERPDLVHAHFATEARIIRSAAAAAQIPLVVTVHGQDLTSAPVGKGWRRRIFRRRLRHTLTTAALIIAVSEFMREKAILYGAPSENVVVHHIGIPLPRHASVNLHPTWDLIFIGRMVEKKGIFDLLDAVAGLPEEIANPSLVLIGGGPEFNAAKKRASDLRVNATFLGPQPHSVVRATLEQSSIFVGPSREASSGDAEGFGMVFLEAAAASLPVVAYAHGGVVEAVEHGITGLLAPEGDVQALTENLAALLLNSDLRHEMGRAGRERVERDFDVEKQTALLERLYDTVLERRSAAEGRIARG